MRNVKFTSALRLSSFALLLISSLFTLTSTAQSPTIQEVFISPVFDADQTITFTVIASNFGEVQLNILEYSFDSDPGPGNAAADQQVQFSPADPATVAVQADGVVLSPGFHSLIVYVRNTEGFYSQPEIRSFEIRPPVVEDPVLVMYEYAFDTDPGIGQATSIDLPQPVTPLEVNLNIEIPLALDPGPHVLYLRFMDNLGNWGVTYYRSFNNVPPLDPSLVDFNGDGVINVQDLMILIAAYPCTGPGCPIDANGDGNTDTNDLLLLFSFFGTTY